MLKEKNYAWMLISLLWLFSFFGSIGRFVQSYYQNEISEYLDVGRAFLGLTWSVNIFISALCAPIGGLLVDKYGYKKVMLLTGVIGNIAILTVLYANTLVGYFIGFGILSGLGGMNASSIYVLVSDWFTNHRAKALMIASSASSLGLAVLTPIFVYYSEWLNWMKLYWILLLIGWGSIFFILFFVRPNRVKPGAEAGLHHQEMPSKKDLKLLENARKWVPNFIQYCKNPTLVVVMIALFTCGFNMGTVERHFIAIQQVAHVHETVFASSLSLLGLLEIVGGLFFSFLIDRINRLLALAILYFTRIIAFACLMMHFELSPILFALLFGASYLGAIPGGILVATEAMQTSYKSMGLQTGVLILVHHIGGVFSGYLGGVNYDMFNNYELLIAIDIGLTAFSAAAYYMMYKAKRIRQIHAASRGLG
ncbi:Predicted arabinose efflux permease, MFS family [Paenibacillus sp. 1_12]|uniref:MFS transporter n=1 Tax=Paenibacillus sp. 1_12 TaxID=1566278 RepID=UPI0008EB8ED0|nr:MFS transporter [Paenibacillus sp. 1_12]SFK75379.1 Predicted arabinose efflux permease, MFS family [Paenibacillus sp. 1_12]